MKIKSCPFCGAAAETRKRLINEYISEMWVECTDCAAKSKTGIIFNNKHSPYLNIACFDSEEDIIRFWNERSYK